MRNEDILRQVKKESRQIRIPESLSPEQMRQRLEQQSVAAKKKKKVKWKGLATAACLCLAFGGSVLAFRHLSIREQILQEQTSKESASEWAASAAAVPEEETLSYPTITYEDIYASMSAVWEEQNTVFRGTAEEPTSGTPLADGAVIEYAEMSEQKNMAAADTFGTTNVQTAGVDEGDIVKNDGRYLYQLVNLETDQGYGQGIQIVDTKDGLKKLTYLDGFEDIAEFYVWQDVLVIIENQYQDIARTERKGMMELTCGIDRSGSRWHEISFYDIADRGAPKKIRTFILQGIYASSRIADGYFYGFSRYAAAPGEGEQDYDAYVPTLGGVRLAADQILLPEENRGTSYLVLVSVDLREPSSFVQTTAVVSAAEQYYVSGENIYVASTEYMEETEGWDCDKTALLKFSYGDGKFAYQAKGEVKGRLDDSFSMDEHEGYLRMVSTVQEFKKEILVDDRTKETIGYEIVDEKQTNALYVLDEDLKVVGSIEGLAENEQIYSARFMGDTGYFVTFRQTDPLFAVDLSEPTAPEVLSELKISGFSEYLHFYGEDRLLGIGMEADEETGRQEGMKLSMFDISDPADVKEIAKKNLSDYNYSEALYNHKAVMISPEANLFGFEAEGSQKGNYWRRYLVFSYENDQFVQELTLEAKDKDGEYRSVRGTFIGDTIYLLSQDGNVQSFDRETGKQLESLEP